MILYFAGGPELTAAMISITILIPVAITLLLYNLIRGYKTSRTKSSRNIYAASLIYFLAATLLFVMPVSPLRSMGAVMILAIFWLPIIIVPAVLIHMLWKKCK